MSDYTTNATVNLSVNGQRAVERLQELRQQAMNLSEASAKPSSLVPACSSRPMSSWR